MSESERLPCESIIRQAEELAKRRYYTQPDRWGHFYRGKNPELKSLADYGKAQSAAEKQARQTVIEGLERIWNTWTPDDFIARRPSPSALQRLAIAFHNHNWDAARSAFFEGINEALAAQQAQNPPPALCQPENGHAEPKSSPVSPPAPAVEPLSLEDFEAFYKAQQARLEEYARQQRERR